MADNIQAVMAETGRMKAIGAQILALRDRAFKIQQEIDSGHLPGRNIQTIQAQGELDELHKQYSQSASRLKQLMKGTASSTFETLGEVATNVNESSTDMETGNSNNNAPNKYSRDPSVELPIRYQEPLILLLGGKSVGRYIQEALPCAVDDDAASLLQNCFTNSSFKAFLKRSRNIHDAIVPIDWAIPLIMTKNLCRNKDAWIISRGIRPDYSASFITKLERVTRLHKGLCLLTDTMGKVNQLTRISIQRQRAVSIVFTRHPTIKYVLNVLVDIARMILAYFFAEAQPPQVTTADQRRATLEVLEHDRLKLTNEFEQAMTSGDLGWFQARYDNEDSDMEEDDADADETACEHCGGKHDA